MSQAWSVLELPYRRVLNTFNQHEPRNNGAVPFLTRPLLYFILPCRLLSLLRLLSSFWFAEYWNFDSLYLIGVEASGLC